VRHQAGLATLASVVLAWRACAFALNIDPQTSSAQVVFANLIGVYAVSVFHYENMNEKLDKNFMRVPKEGYVASNNPKKKMGPPTFDETKFQLGVADQSVEIKLMY
jgi:uncharacterized protein (DUF2141 family)